MLKNSSTRYGALSKSLHWSVALLIIGLVWLGWYMVDLTYYDRWYNDSLSTHKALGMLVLILAVAKVGWTLYSRPPELVASLRGWERAAARVTHFTLYFMMLAIPLTGYAISTSKGDAVSVFGWFQIPAVFPVGEGLRDLAIELHFYFAYVTAALVVLHASAALKHHFVDKDDTLKKML
jgi:cytochrome b561